MNWSSIASWIGYAGNVLKSLAGNPTNSNSATPSAPSASAPVTTAGTSLGLGIGITTDIGPVANAIGEVAKVVGQVNAEENTPAMVDAANAKKLQAERDRITKDIVDAEKNNNFTNIEKDLS